MASNCIIMSDSTCDFSAEMASRLNVVILPFHYVEAGKPDGGLSGNDDLFQSISAHEFYDAIRQGACPMTSQPSQLEYEEAFEKVHATGTPAILFTITSGLSGGYEGAVMALQRFKETHVGENVDIRVVDTSVTSTPMTLFVEQACLLRDEGKTADQIYEWALEARWHLQTLFMVDNLNALHRGGRIPKSVAVIGDALDVKPMLRFNLDGTLAICGVARGRHKGLKKLASYFQKNADLATYGHVVAIGDADSPADGYAVASSLLADDPELRVLRPTIGPTIGSHVGPGMVSCCFWGEDRRNAKQGGKVRGVREE